MQYINLSFHLCAFLKLFNTFDKSFILQFLASDKGMTVTGIPGPYGRPTIAQVENRSTRVPALLCLGERFQR